MATPLSVNLKEWYHKAYETDEIWEDFDDEVTFTEIYNALKYGEEVYDYIPHDSLVRERVFEQLTKILSTETKTYKGIEYDNVYEAWLNKEPIRVKEFPSPEVVMEERYL